MSFFNSVLLAFVVGFVVCQVATLATTLYLHRTLSHRAITMRPWLLFLFRPLLWMTTGIRPREWVAVHRKHHAYTDVEGDPHSPKLLGWVAVQFGNVGLYRKVATDPEQVRRYAPRPAAGPMGPRPVRSLVAGAGHRDLLPRRRVRSAGRAARRRSSTPACTSALNAAVNAVTHTSATARSTTPPRISSGSRCSPSGKGCTTTTTPRRPPPSSPSTGANIDLAWPLIARLAAARVDDGAPPGREAQAGQPGCKTGAVDRLPAARVVMPTRITGPAVVVVDGGRIVAIEPTSQPVPDRTLAPGFVDLQVNGIGAVDVAERRRRRLGRARSCAARARESRRGARRS